MRVVLHMGKLLVILLVAWLLALIFLTGPLLKNSDNEEALAKKLIDAQKEAMTYKRELDSLRTKLLSSVGEPSIVDQVTPEPSREYETFRRRAYRDVQEMWFFTRAKLNALKKEASGSVSDKISEVVSEMELREQVVLLDLERLKEADGHDDWRLKEAEELSSLVQARLKHLQNPGDCSTARKLVCNLNKGCGYGCQIHHAIYCFLVAYGTERTLILKSTGWRYNKKGFEEVFLPLSETCMDQSGEY